MPRDFRDLRDLIYAYRYLISGHFFYFLIWVAPQIPALLMDGFVWGFVIMSVLWLMNLVFICRPRTYVWPRYSFYVESCEESHDKLFRDRNAANTPLHRELMLLPRHDLIMDVYRSDHVRNKLAHPRAVERPADTIVPCATEDMVNTLLGNKGNQGFDSKTTMNMHKIMEGISRVTSKVGLTAPTSRMEERYKTKNHYVVDPEGYLLNAKYPSFPSYPVFPSSYRSPAP